jgi:hypothetical protein
MVVRHEPDILTAIRRRDRYCAGGACLKTGAAGAGAVPVETGVAGRAGAGAAAGAVGTTVGVGMGDAATGGVGVGERVAVAGGVVVAGVATVAGTAAGVPASAPSVLLASPSSDLYGSPRPAISRRCR